MLQEERNRERKREIHASAIIGAEFLINTTSNSLVYLFNKCRNLNTFPCPIDYDLLALLLT